MKVKILRDLTVSKNNRMKEKRAIIITLSIIHMLIKAIPLKERESQPLNMIAKDILLQQDILLNSIPNLLNILKYPSIILMRLTPSHLHFRITILPTFPNLSSWLRDQYSPKKARSKRRKEKKYD